MEDENVTIRRHKTMANDSLDLSFESTNSQIRRHSLPDLSTGYDSDREDLRKELLKLKSELESAHLEIFKLNEENKTLKNTLHKQISKSIAKEKCSEPKKKITNTSRNTRGERTSRNQGLSSDEVNTSCIDLGANGMTTGGATGIGTGSIRCNFVDCEINSSSHRVRGDDGSTLKPLLSEFVHPSKLCIVSSNQVNSILSTAQNTFPSYDICHYILSNCGIKQLTDNLDKKLSNFTIYDYCLIFIGGKDFEKTSNYHELVSDIRDALIKLQHTNIILCLPTYKFNGCSVMYNSRIETFSNLLYRDIYTHNYALLFDSNLNLKYDDTMFFKRSGVLNNNGLRIIFDNLKYQIYTDFHNSTVTAIPPESEPRKGTIPYYFSIKKTIAVNNSPVHTNKDSFFRKPPEETNM